ncbi:MAG: SUMF1/EgtB/PvdO family nonheme iron enzyme [Burkholderiales bacterium]|nr:SUMF1/EgtB/PvdO family nonheme iron enzyme [Burkholderiales bacterium]
MTGLFEAAHRARNAGPSELAAALESSRQDTLETFAFYEHSLDALTVPLRETLNPPLWELGHVGWFQEYWIARNPLRFAGVGADPAVPRLQGLRSGCDALYDSGRVAHDTRWSLPLPDAAGTRDDLSRQLAETLAWIRRADASDEALYFFRLALFHEDMHHEAALYMAQDLGIAVDDSRWQAAPMADECTVLSMEPGPWSLGHPGRGFVFDNECGAHSVDLPASHIDSRVARWAEYLPFVDSGGYEQPRWWTQAGAAWLAAERPCAPRYLRRLGSTWEEWRHGRWRTLDPMLPACHLTTHEAEAWCRWAGRRLPTEAEWERAALERPAEFEWGAVWEWTADAFRPYPGFEAHPYRDYSAPWFGSRRALRGASFMTQPRMRHPRYRNFFMAHRNDVPAGFRSCAA